MDRVAREVQFRYIENLLGVSLPNSYRDFLLERGAAVIDGFKILGLPTKETRSWKIKSVLEGTQILRWKRPELSKNLVAISIRGTKALCLVLREENETDTPLVEVDLKDNSEPKPLGKTFREWMELHEIVSKRFSIAWNRIKARQEEAKRQRGSGVWKWSTIINRVRDYVIGVAAFRYNDLYGCLEVDEFYPIDQPHLKKGAAIRILLNEIFSRARDYSGSLKVIFTKDAREDEIGRVPPELQDIPSRREPRPVPQELVDLATKYGVSFKEAERGIISHKEGVDLWFSLLDLPPPVRERIYELEEAGYLSREIIAEIVATGIWSREEVIWIFQNASRPEALLLGTDLPEDRLFYADSLYWGRAVLLAVRFQQAIMAELTGSLSLEEIEKREERYTLEPMENAWILRCNRKFQLPPSWMYDGSGIEVEAGEPILLLPRPTFPSRIERDKKWIGEEIKFLKNLKGEIRVRCLLLSYEFVTPDYNENLEEIREMVRRAARAGVTILFAPTRMELYLDEEVRKRMRRARKLKHFPQRKGALKLQILDVPSQWWDPSRSSLTSRRIRNASESAELFAEQLVQGRDIPQHRMEFSLMCEVIEREALKNCRIAAEVEGEDSRELIEALQHREDIYHGVTFPYVKPDDMPQFLRKLQNRKLLSIFKRIEGGAVITTKPWEKSPAPFTRKVRAIDRPFPLPQGVKERIDRKVAERKEERKYVSSWRTIDRAHNILQQALSEGIPLSMASFGGRIRSAVFIETIKDYVYSAKGIEPRTLPIAYSDGSEGEPFPLFSLPEIERPKGRFFLYPVSLVSLRHMDVDRVTERALVRNREIQLCETAAEQEMMAFRRTCECIDELIKVLKGEVGKEEVSLGLRAFLMMKPELLEEEWDGLEMHIYHATGLEPAGVGAYRAVLEMLKRYRGQLIVVPRIFSRGEYRPAEEWY
ncbi:hypothetical protein DRN43_06700 [Thermococci archaeon]|nr:MAG: hypothetical protein DRN43_06700 [Thermococci archaeon]